MSTPQVSVVIPTRDRPSLLARHALPSALGQAGVDVEVIVVDDGSVDAAADRVEGLREERVRLLRHGRPRGRGAARNAGIDAARGEWIAFLDDDDLWAPDKLRVQLATAARADWSYARGIVVDESLTPIDTLVPPEPHALADALRHGNVLVGGGSAVVVRRAVLDEVGTFDESLALGQDWDLWLRLASRPAVASQETLVATLEHGGRSALQSRRRLVASVEEILRRSGGDRDDRRAAAEWVANEYFRGGRRFDASLLYLRASLLFRSPGNLPPALGALFGRRGMEVAAWLLRRVAGGSHLDLGRDPPAESPSWLERYRT